MGMSFSGFNQRTPRGPWFIVLGLTRKQSNPTQRRSPAVKMRITRDQFETQGAENA